MKVCPFPTTSAFLSSNRGGNALMELGLTGKAALISGASQGIGAAIAHEFAREGVHVCLDGRGATMLNGVADAIPGSANLRTVIHAGDLRLPEEPEAAVATAMAAFSKLGILVNNAGTTKRADFFALTVEDWHDGFALKFHGYV